MRQGYNREDLAALIEAAGFDLRRVEHALVRASREANSPYVSREQVLKCLDEGERGGGGGQGVGGPADAAFAARARR